MCRRRGRLFVVASVVVLLSGLLPAVTVAQVDRTPLDAPSPAPAAAIPPTPDPEAQAPDAGTAPEPTVVVPFQGTGYHYRVFPIGGGPADFFEEAFDDSGFATDGHGAFASGGGCAIQATKGTTWPSNTDILIRKSIDLPAGTTGVVVTGGIDNDVFLYWNGNLILPKTHEGCASQDEFTLAVPDEWLHAGTNVLAARGRDRGVESWFDVQVTAVVHPATPPVANAGGDQSVTEGDVVTLDGTGSSDPDGSPLSYSWALLDHTGPPVVLSAASGPTTTFATTDDGVYHFRLTVSDGSQAASDDVSVTVGNGKPVISATGDPAYANSVALVTTSFSDPGVIDTHTSRLDWGDGSAPDTYAATVDGAGWGSFVSTHVYAQAGNYPVTITVIDDDGGTATTTVAGLSVGTPIALWANSNSTDAAMESTSGAIRVEGLTHTNDDLRIRGAAKTFVGPTEYVRTLDVGGGGATFTPTPRQTTIQPFPITFDVATYRPGGKAALAAGSAYHDMSAQCGSSATWSANGGSLASGIYYAPCGAHLSGSSLGGTITLVAEGPIQVSGSGALFDPYTDGLLFLSGSNSTSAIKVDASNSTFFGYSFARTGRIVLSGSSDRFYCGILADQIDISAQDLFVHGSACSTPARTVISPVIVPTLVLALAADKADAEPGAAISHAAQVSNAGATLVVPGILALENLGTAGVTVTGHELALEYLSAGGSWLPVPGTITTTVRPNAFAGVTYPAGGDRLDGTTIAAGALASWGYADVVRLNASQAALLLDPSRAQAIRVRSTFTIDPPTVPVRRLFRFGDDIAVAIRAQGATARNVAVSVIPPVGAGRTFTKDDKAGLANLAPGDQVTVNLASTVPVPAPRNAAEADAAYLARLAALDGTPLIGIAFAHGTAGVGTILAPGATSTTVRHVPIVSLANTGPTTLEPGTTAAYSLALDNVGSARARAVAVNDSVVGAGAVPVTGAPSAIDAGDGSVAHASYPVPSTTTALSITNTGSVTWTDTAGNAYGLVADAFSTRLIAARKLLVTKTDFGHDVGGQFVIDYDIAVTNVGAQPISAVALTDPLDPYTSLVPGSVRTSQGTIITGADVAIDIGTIVSGASVSAGFRVTLAGPVPQDIDGVRNQATITSASLDPVLSDDPELPGVTDPTFTAVFGTGGGSGGGGGTQFAHPVIGTLAPADGTVVTEPVSVTVPIAPADGFQLSSWAITTHPADTTGGERTLASSMVTGSGPTTASAVFDPTVLPNGTWLVTVTAVGSDGGVSVSTTSVIVDGNLKLGRYTTTYDDVAVQVGGLPMQVLRTYDSFDKTRGDFGVGWRVEIANFRIQVNRPLGYGGWVQELTACGVFCTTTYHSTTPHVVTVIWPDGHEEIFDMKPKNGSTFFGALTEAAFVGRARATSTLDALDNGLTWTGDGNLYGGGFGSAGVYDPTRFRLTARDGTAYVLDRGVGLVSATDRNGNTLTIDASGVHSSRGSSITFHRDPAGRIDRITDPDGHFLTYGYTGDDLTSVTDQNSRTVTYAYQGNHNLQLTKDPLNRPIRTLHYGPDGRLTSVTDGNDHETRIDVDPTARTETITSPGGALTTITTFDPLGDPLRIDQIGDGRTLSTRFQYDPLGRVISKKDPLNHETVVTWWPTGDPKTVREPSGALWQYDYDDFGSLRSVVDPSLRTLLTMTYDTAGNPKTKVVAGVGTTTYVYQGGLIQSETGPSGTTNYLHFPSGMISSRTEPGNRTWTFAYDGEGRVTSVTNPALEASSLGYDGLGNVVRVTDGRLHDTTYAWDYAGRMTSLTDADHVTATWVYDPGGRLDHELDRNGATVAYGYDPLGHVTSVSLPGGVAETYRYDAFGFLREATNADARLTLDYDDAGALVRQASTGTSTSDQPAVTLTLGQDPQGRLATVGTPWGPTAITYNPDGRIQTVEDPQHGIFAFGWDPDGQLASLQRPNGVNDTYGYAPTGYLASRTSRLGSTVVDAYSATFDAASRIDSVTDAAGRHALGYDAAGRLISVDHPAGFGVPDEGFAYDAAGNRSGAGQAYDNANRLTTDATTDYGYDGEGNLISRRVRATGATTVYHWNALHWLTSVDLPNGTTVRYRYDALGRRVESSSPTRTTRYVNLGANVVAEYSGANALVTSYVVVPGDTSPGRVLESRTGGATRYPIVDGVGSVTALTDASGTVTPFSYSAFGAPSGASAGTYGFGTYGFDAETGLYYARARYYDPGLGRFLSEDPRPSANPYPYAASSPAMASDPTGELIFEYSAQQANSREEAFLLVRDAGQFYADQGMTLLEGATEGEMEFLVGHQWALRRTLGTVINRLVAQSLRRAGVESLHIGPDFLFTIGEESIYVELTTPAQIAAHELRAAYDARYAVAEFVTYLLAL